MKIINLNGLSGNSITVDSTVITVDSTVITVDANYGNLNLFEIKVIPKVYVDSVELTLFNELTETNFTTIVPTVIQNGYMIIQFYFQDVFEGDSFELTLRETLENKVIYRTKAYATAETDLENFKLIQDNNNDGIIKM